MTPEKVRKLAHYLAHKCIQGYFKELFSRGIVVSLDPLRVESAENAMESALSFLVDSKKDKINSKKNKRSGGFVK